MGTKEEEETGWMDMEQVGGCRLDFLFIYIIRLLSKRHAICNFWFPKWFTPKSLII